MSELLVTVCLSMAACAMVKVCEHGLVRLANQ
jgi:hypothetical protein